MGFHTVSINIQVNNQDIDINGLYCIQNTDIGIEVNGKLLTKENIRNFDKLILFQENYLGEDQKFTDFEDANQTPRKSGQGNLGPLSEEKYSQPKPFDERYYRPFAVTVSVAIHEIHGHLVKVDNDLYIYFYFQSTYMYMYIFFKHACQTIVYT